MAWDPRDGATPLDSADTLFPQANDNRVGISQQPGLEAAVDTMSLRLLTPARSHPLPDPIRGPALSGKH